ncbi:hypothetical protein Tco_0529618 [Tanacetum coccineum]
MTTLAEFMIVVGGENCPPMLDKTMYDSWESRMELYIEGKENDKMMLNSVKNGPLIRPTVDEDGVTRVKRYEELSVTEKLQADCDLRAANILPPPSSPQSYLPPSVAQQPHADFYQSESNLVVLSFQQGEDPIDCIKKAMATIQDGRVTIQQVQGRQVQSYVGTGHMERQYTKPKRKMDVTWYKEKVLLVQTLEFLADPRLPDGQAAQTTIPQNAAFQTEDLDA